MTPPGEHLTPTMVWRVGERTAPRLHRLDSTVGMGEWESRYPRLRSLPRTSRAPRWSPVANRWRKYKGGCAAAARGTASAPANEVSRKPFARTAAIVEQRLNASHRKTPNNLPAV